ELNCIDAQSNRYEGKKEIRKFGDNKFNVTITAPHYENLIPAIGYGSYNLTLRFSETVSVNSIKYELLDGTYRGTITEKSISADKKTMRYLIVVPVSENNLKNIEGFMNAQLMISASSLETNGLTFTENDADNIWFTIDTMPPSAEIKVN
ncbi:MAG: hypothetical protein NTV63_00610, partial [Candidatus Woesearchaeota archaeon]|nr:hypothetical protein [Candidatus Woesearchaeota archaeon]